MDVRQQIILLDGFEDGNTINFGQVYIQHNDAWGLSAGKDITMVRPDVFQRLFPVSEDLKLVFPPVFIKTATQYTDITWIVLNNEDAGRTCGFHLAHLKAVLRSLVRIVKKFCQIKGIADGIGRRPIALTTVRLLRLSRATDPSMVQHFHDQSEGLDEHAP
jgi:hypothetical protein